MMERTRRAWAVVGLVLCMSLPASAQPAPESAGGEEGAAAGNPAAPTEAPAAKGPSDPLSAEERIRRATVPPPGKDCAPDPKAVEDARLEVERARNLDFSMVTNTTIEQAREIAGREWEAERSRIDVASKADWKGHWESWLTGHAERELWGNVFSNPCRSPGVVPDDRAIPTTRSGADGSSPDRNRGGAHLGLSEEDSRVRPGSNLAIEMFSAVVFGSFTREQGPFIRDEWRGEPEESTTQLPKHSRDLFSFMAGLSPSDTGEGRVDCSEDGKLRQSDQLFAVVRGALVGGHGGAEILLASASNVPVACSVEVLIERKGAEVARKSLVFVGAGRQGGIVKETALGFGPDPYGDDVTLSTACVPRLVWGGGDVVAVAKP